MSIKNKIILISISLLIPFALLSINLIKQNILKSNDIKQNLLGLEYNNKLRLLSIDIAKHRGLIHSYANSYSDFEKDIFNLEKQVDQEITNIQKFDDQNLNILYKNIKIQNIITLWENTKLSNIENSTHKEESFLSHTALLNVIIESIELISKETHLKNTASTINTIMNKKIITLNEHIGQLRGLGAGILAKKEINQNDVRTLLALYGMIEEEINSLNKEELISSRTKKLSTSIKEFLKQIDDQLLLTDFIKSDPKDLFYLGEKTIKNTQPIYLYLDAKYKDIIFNKIEKNYTYNELIIFFLTLVIIVNILLSNFLYKSILLKNKKLEESAFNVVKGNFDNKLEYKINDEYADLISAFNLMSESINQNMAFLDGYKMAIDESSIVSKTDKKGIITYANDKFCEISGYSREELIGKPHNIIRHPDVPKEAFKKMWETIKSKQVWHGIVKNRKKDSDYYIVDATIIPIVDNNKDIIEYVAVRHDITELEKGKEELRKQKTDLLTGLPNRNQILEDIITFKHPILIFININSFAKLNDFYGTQIGDKVLVSLSKWLKHIANDSNVNLYKLHADEFALLNEEGDFTRLKYLDFISKIITYIESNKIVCNNNNCITITVTAGIAFYDKNNEYKEMLTNANIALKKAKKSSKKFLTYDDTMRQDENYEKNMHWIERIKEAIHNNRIITYFQPIVDNKTQTCNKFECLARLKEENGDIVSPFHFLDIAKQAKLYPEITKIVITKAFKTFENLKDYEFSINLTLEDIEDTSTIALLIDKLSSYPNPSRVILEIVESEEIKDYNMVSSFIKQVKEFGAKIAIDDFGSGYSNFEHILSLDADFLKIDGSLIKNIDTDEESRIITSAIIAFSKKLNRKTIVEYVHNEKIYEIVREIGADYSQGYFLGEPQSQPKIDALYEKKIEVFS
jgi:PAS domain S-box-containing protein/diguanylate cyclase (GGDEF)-like protein